MAQSVDQRLVTVKSSFTTGAPLVPMMIRPLITALPEVPDCPNGVRRDTRELRTTWGVW